MRRIQINTSNIPHTLHVQIMRTSRAQFPRANQANYPGPMRFDPDDKRPLFQQVVDDYTTKILERDLVADDRLPTAAQIAEEYGIASMTAQRALRELQALGLTYARPGKGTFVHPEAHLRLAQARNYTNQRQVDAAHDSFREIVDPLFAALDEAIEAKDLDRITEARDAMTQGFRHYLPLMTRGNTYALAEKIGLTPDEFDKLTPEQINQRSAAIARKQRTAKHSDDAQPSTEE